MNVPPLNRRGRSSRPSLGRLLYRAHLVMALAAVCMAGLAVTVIGLWSLRAYADYNLQLIGRSMAYTVEAAVVFHDRAAVEEALNLICSSEEVSRCAVYDRYGQILAEWQRAHDLGSFGHWIGSWLFNQESVQPIVRDGLGIGEIHLRGSGGRLLAFLFTGLGGMLAGLLLTALGALYLSRRMVGRIITPLERLAQVARAVRRERQFARRVAPARIAELDELGSDFNALLDELEAWQSHLERENASLAHQASHDSLTHLPNRAFFEGRLSRTLRELATTGERAAVLFIDSDRFKEINDGLGHAAGDAVLVDLAMRIRGQLREGDLVARLGGDEFAVLLTPIQDSDAALRIADDIIASMAVPIPLPDGGSVSTSLTVGIALYPEHGRSPAALLHSADTAMYRAKRSARGTRCLASPLDMPTTEDSQEIYRDTDALEPALDARGPYVQSVVGRLSDSGAAERAQRGADPGA